MPWPPTKLLIPYLFVVFYLNSAITSAAFESFSDNPKEDTITIGLLVDNLQDGEQAILAAQLAINQSNLNRGESGSLFKLAIREMDGPWGQASNKTVELIYEERAVAIVGALDGRAAHLTEQVTAKSQIPYIETKAADPSLSRAFVPWFFRIVPNDIQISKALVTDIYERNKYSRVAIISDLSYDGNLATMALKKVIEEKQLRNPTYFTVDENKPNYNSIISQLKTDEFQAIVLLTYNVIRHTKLQEYLELSSSRIYHNQILRELQALSSYPVYGIEVVADPLKHEEYNIQFQKLTNSMPTAQAIYVFDAINILLHTINAVGPNPEIIGQNIGRMDVYNGISGQIKFDKYGDLVRSIQFTSKIF